METQQRSRPRHDRSLHLKMAPTSATPYRASVDFDDGRASGLSSGTPDGLVTPSARDVAESQRAHAVDQSVLEQQAFFASATHDLKAPLTGLTLWMDMLELLGPRLAGSADTEAATLLEQALAHMQTLVQRSVHRVDDILDVMRAEAGRPAPFSPGEVDLVALARETVQEWPADGHHVLRTETAESELWGWWDGVRLTRLVENLLDNAIKYSPTGCTITLRIATADADGRRWAVLEVEDHGIGIPAAELSQVFEPFHRAHNVTQRIAGNGLGLWGCRTIVEQHAGRLAVASLEGEGTTFSVHLPLAQAGA